MLRYCLPVLMAGLLAGCAATPEKQALLIVQCGSPTGPLTTAAYAPPRVEVTTQNRRTILHFAEPGKAPNDYMFDQNNSGRCIITAESH